MLIALLLLSFFAGCGKKGDDMSEIEVEEAPSQKAAPKKPKEEITLPWENKQEEAPKEGGDDSDKPKEKPWDERVKERISEVEKEIEDKQKELINIHEEEKSLRGEVAMGEGLATSSNMEKRKELRIKSTQLNKDIKSLKIRRAKLIEALKNYHRRKRKRKK